MEYKGPGVRSGNSRTIPTPHPQLIRPLTTKMAGCMCVRRTPCFLAAAAARFADSTIDVAEQFARACLRCTWARSYHRCSGTHTNACIHTCVRICAHLPFGGRTPRNPAECPASCTVYLACNVLIRRRARMTCAPMLLDMSAPILRGYVLYPGHANAQENLPPKSTCGFTDASASRPVPVSESRPFWPSLDVQMCIGGTSEVRVSIADSTPRLPKLPSTTGCLGKQPCD